MICKNEGHFIGKRRKPILYRRPTTAPNGSMREKNVVLKGGTCHVKDDSKLRPHSAPLPTNISLQCNSHKHSEFYDVTCNKDHSYKDHVPYSNCFKNGIIQPISKSLKTC